MRASCCVIVLPPSHRPAQRVADTARPSAIGSMPGCRKKRWSSTATNACCRYGAIARDRHVLALLVEAEPALAVGRVEPRVADAARQLVDGIALLARARPRLTPATTTTSVQQEPRSAHIGAQETHHGPNGFRIPSTQCCRECMRRKARPCWLGRDRLFVQDPVNEGDGDRTLADRGRDTLDAAAGRRRRRTPRANSSRAGTVARERPCAGEILGRQIGPGLDEALSVERDAPAQPRGARRRACHHEDVADLVRSPRAGRRFATDALELSPPSSATISVSVRSAIFRVVLDSTNQIARHRLRQPWPRTSM